MYKSLTFYFPIILLLTTLSSCTDQIVEKKSKQHSFEFLTAARTGIDFSNIIAESPSRTITFFDYFYNGGGVGLGDFDNDGLTDVFFTGNDSSNRLFRNQGGFEFEDITQVAGLTSSKWSNGVNVCDFNDDGYLDIYVSNGGPSDDEELLSDDFYINNGDGTFTESSAKFGLGFNGRSVQSTFFDFDNDGDLDLWVNSHGKRREKKGDKEWLDYQQTKSEDQRAKQSCVLYENIGGKFVDISKQAGVQKLCFGLGIVVKDINADGWLDVYVANDYLIPDYLFINNGDKTFTENIKYAIDQASFFSMGCDMEDINNDGEDDLIVVDMSPQDHYRSKLLMNSMNVANFNWLTLKAGFVPQYMNNSVYLGISDGAFSEVGAYLGLSNTEWSWSPLLADFDNDGDKDVYITNGFYRETKNNDLKIERQKLKDSLGDAYNLESSFSLLQNIKPNPILNNYYRNEGDLSFKESAVSVGLTYPSLSNGAAYGDLDNDGDLDIVVNNQMAPASIIKNNASGNYLKVKLDPQNGAAVNLHTVIRIFYEGIQQTKNYYFTKGFQSTMDQNGVYFGLGDIEVIDSVKVEWKDGTVSVLENLKANREIVIGKQTAKTGTSGSSDPYLFEITKQIPSFNDLFQSDSLFDDFEKEILLPHKYSDMSAALATGDLDGDGLDDLVLGGSSGFATVIMVQRKGVFQKLDVTQFMLDAKYEDLAIELFDADGDGDLDIYIASGGGGDVTDPRLLQDRLYLNTGNLNFAATAFPKVESSTATVIPWDIDADGDLDLFVGGRNMPGKFPLLPKSYIFQNDNGGFTDVSLLYGIDTLGMITDATLTDIDLDGVEELVIVGEFMEPLILTTHGGIKATKITKSSFSIEKMSGFWQSIETSDFNKDGKPDFVLGNLGLNNKFSGPNGKGLHIYANDFDNSGSLDIVLAKEYKGRQVPVRGRECSSQQMPFIEDNFETYHKFASASLSDIYSHELLDSGEKREVNQFGHILLLSNGKQYDVSLLPAASQLGPILDMVLVDIDKDGNHDDLVCVGAIANTEPETRPYVSNKGTILFFEDEGFSAEFLFRKTGLHLPGNTKSIKEILLDGTLRAYVVGNNNGQVQIIAQK